MEIIAEFFKDIFLKSLSWILSFVWKRGFKMLEKILFRTDEDIIVSGEQVEFRFNENSNKIDITYRLENRTYYPFEINGIQAVVKVFTYRIATINHLAYISVERKNNIVIRIEYNLNEFESNRIRDLKGDLQTLNCEIEATHFIKRKKENSSFFKRINDSKSILVSNIQNTKKPKK
jgi:hypothetical protein